MLSVVVEMKMFLSANHANSEATPQHAVAASGLRHRSIRRARSCVSFCVAVSDTLTGTGSGAPEQQLGSLA